MTKGSLARGQSPAVLLLAISLASPLVAVASGFTFTTIDFPGAPQTALYGINAQGQIVGSYGPGTGGLGALVYSFLLDKGAFSTIEFPSAPNTTAAGANNPRGEIVGLYLDGSGNDHGFVLGRGAYTSVDAPFPGAAGTTVLTGINPQGQIVGSYLAPGQVGHGFQLEGGVFTMLPQFPGSSGTFPTTLNASGHVTGTWIDPNGTTIHGFLLVNGIFTGLDDPEAGKLNCTGVAAFGFFNCSTGSFVINDHDQIAGYFVKDDGTTHGFLLSQGVYTTIDFPGAVVTLVLGINDAGQMVGAYFDSVGVSHGFLATPEH